MSLRRLYARTIDERFESAPTVPPRRTSNTERPERSQRYRVYMEQR